MKSIMFKPSIWVAKQKVLSTRTAVTRRLDHLKYINQEPDSWKYVPNYSNGYYFVSKYGGDWIVRPPYHPGEIAYVQEAWWTYSGSGAVHFASTEKPPTLSRHFGKLYSPLSLKAIHARSFLQVLSVRPERFWLAELSQTELALEGGEPALPYLKLLDGKWDFRYEIKSVARPEGI